MRVLLRAARVARPCLSKKGGLQGGLRFLRPVALFSQTRAVFEEEKPKFVPSFVPSTAQLKIAKLCRTQNVVVTAKPGSGKTATIEVVLAKNPDKKALVITHSKRLQNESQHRFERFGNCEVYTFHAVAGPVFGGKIFPRSIDLHEERQKLLASETFTPLNFGSFDIIVLDEFQDCTDLYLWLSNVLVYANNRGKTGPPATIVVLGDQKQCINKFMKADDSYLTQAPKILGHLNPYPFAQMSLGKSFRLSKQTADFVNNAFLSGEQYIRSDKPGAKPIIIRYQKKDVKDVLAKLFDLIEKHGPENTAFLAPSVRTNRQLRKFVNTLNKKYRVPISVPSDDEFPLIDEVIRGKVSVSTINQFKGSERDLVVLFDVDDSYFKYVGRDLPDDRCPNLIYVALTRAKSQLVLVHNDEKKMMPFVDIEAMSKSSTIINMTGQLGQLAPPGHPGRPPNHGLGLPKNVGVRDATRYLQECDLRDIIERELCVREIAPPLPEKEHIYIRDVVLSDKKRDFYESVSDLNGMVVVATFEHATKGTLRSLAVDAKDIALVPSPESKEYIPWLCRRACAYDAENTGYTPRETQMRFHSFKWISRRAQILALERLRQVVMGDAAVASGRNLEFEVFAEQHVTISEGIETYVSGRPDIVATSPQTHKIKPAVIWEIKFVASLSDENFIQAAMYAFLHSSPGDKRLPRIILYNVRDGNQWEITPRHGRDGLLRMIKDVLTLRYTKVEEQSDEGFDESCKKTTAEVSDFRMKRSRPAIRPERRK